MAKARPCPLCSQYFNPKFGGRQVDEMLVCADCFVRKMVANQKRNTPKANQGLARNQANHSVN